MGHFQEEQGFPTFSIAVLSLPGPPAHPFSPLMWM